MVKYMFADADKLKISPININ